MRTVEFDAEVSDSHTLSIPPELAQHVPIRRPVHVTLFLEDQGREASGEVSALMATFGACQGDPSLIGIFEEIDRYRHIDFGRDIEVP